MWFAAGSQCKTLIMAAVQSSLLQHVGEHCAKDSSRGARQAPTVPGFSKALQAAYLEPPGRSCCCAQGGGMPASHWRTDVANPPWSPGGEKGTVIGWQQVVDMTMTHSGHSWCQLPMQTPPPPYNASSFKCCGSLQCTQLHR